MIATEQQDLPMKQFLAILFVICGLGAAGYYCYEPYIKPMLEKSGGGGIHSASDRVIDEQSGSAPAANSKAKGQTPSKPAASQSKGPAKTKTVAPKPEAPKSEIDLLVEKKYPMPQILPLNEIVQDWKVVPPNAYPAEVTSNENLAFSLVVNGQNIGSSNTAPGVSVKPVRLIGDQLTVSSLANPTMSTQVHVDKTDFKQRIQKRYDDFVASTKSRVAEKRAKAKAALEARPDRMASLQGGEVGPSDDPRFGPVKASLAKGEVPTVKLEEAKSYRWNGSEKIGGEKYPGTYDTVTVDFEVETIFGKFPIDVKCLMRGGKVVGWIDPITEEEI